MKEPKPSPIPTYQSMPMRSGPGCGCVLVGIGAVCLIFVTMCIGSYYVTLHTSLPLTLIKSALEAEGNVKVDGLRGSISSGFEIDRLQFEGEGGHWSELRDIRFKFNGFMDLARYQRLIIQEASVAGGTIYALFENEGEFDFDPQVDSEEIASEVSEGLEEFREELESEEDLDQLTEMRIDLVSVANLDIVNPETEVTLQIKRIEFRDFQMLRGQITKLGNLLIESDQLDLDTAPSEIYADYDVAWKLTGRIKSRLHKRLVADIPFQVDFAVADKNQVRTQCNLFEGKVKLTEPLQENWSYELIDFSPAEYFEMQPPLSPSRWNVTTTFQSGPLDESPDESPDESADISAEARETKSGKLQAAVTMSIDAGGTFFLGDSPFTILTEQIVIQPDEDSSERPYVEAQGEHRGQPVTARLYLLDRMPWVATRLESEQVADSRELWAAMFFGKPFAELEPEQQSQVVEAIEFGNTEETGHSQ